MSQQSSLPTREELPIEKTWNLEMIFPNIEAFDAAFTQLQEESKKASEVEGTLGQGAAAFKRGIETMLSCYRQLEVLYVYAHQKNDQDTTNTTYQGLYTRAGSLFTEVSAAFSWFEPELLSLEDEKIWGYFAEDTSLEVYRHFVENIIDGRPHILSQNEEALLAAAGEVFGTASNTFAILNNSDFEFPMVLGEDGKEIRLTHGLYGQLLESNNREVRESAFKGMYSVYQQFKNTLAMTLSSHVKTHNYRGKVRQYESAREAALSGNKIPESVYDTLLLVVRENLPLLHRYVALRKRLLKVEKLHMYDMYTPILGEAPIKYSYEEAQAIVLKALAPLGEEYLSIVEQAFADRWIDVIENKGKRSGAYSSGSYDTAPYILLNWHDSLDQMFTLIHEMGHSVHSYFTRHNQPYVYGDYSIFLAEIASTTNENILTEYLLETEKDPRVQAYILNHYLDGFKGTIFRQTQFAEFEHFIHQQDAAGVPLTSDFLMDYYGNLNAEYYGPEVEKDSEIAVEWARIPHFYSNYYVYQYATGFSAASALAEKILSNNPEDLTRYLNYLKAGSSDYPIEVMKKAGVDMTKGNYIEDAMKVFEKRLIQLENLIETLEK